MTKQHYPLAKRSAPVPVSNTMLHEDGFGAISPPSTPPPRRTRGTRSQSGPRVSTRVSNRRTFLEEVTPVDVALGRDGVDERDPHDLAFSSRHVTRASVVDNMLIALDEFSNHTPNAVAARDLSDDATMCYGSFAGHRRGNTFSSGISSENGSKPDEIGTPQSVYHDQGSYHDPDLVPGRGRKMVPGLYEEEESKTRKRVFDSQRAFAHKKGQDTWKGSGSSSIDLGQTLTNCNFDRRAHRRSRSFDFGSNRRRFPIFEHDNVANNDINTNANNPYSFADEMEAAPTPIVRAGPSRGHSPARQNTAAPLTPLYGTDVISRRGSTKSSKSLYARRDRAGTRRSTTTKDRDELRNLQRNLENLPPMPNYLSSPAQSPTLPTHKTSQMAIADIVLPPKERSGFFRRVFGSKSAGGTGVQVTEAERDPLRAALTASPTHETFRASAGTSKLHRSSPKDVNSTINASPREPQTLTKKSSAFFRRRKKSSSGQIPTPLPLSLHPAKVEAAEKSPVSSLRQVLNPYLTEMPLPSPKPETGNGSPRGFYTAQTSFPQSRDGVPPMVEKEQVLSAEAESMAPPMLKPSSKSSEQSRGSLGDQLEGTFLADSSGTEATSTQSRQTTPGHSSAGIPESSPSHPSSRGQAPERPLAVRFPFSSTSTSGEVTPPSGGSVTPDSTSTPTLPNSTGEIAETTYAKTVIRKSRRSRRGPPPSVYKSAPSTPFVSSGEKEENAGEERGETGEEKEKDGGEQGEENGEGGGGPPPTINITTSSELVRERGTLDEARDQALKIFENRDENLDPGEASAWLGDAGEARELVRLAYMDLFDWTAVDILSALRGLCARIALKGESQQVDRMLEAFSKRWCDCNSSHGFKSSDVVHTICYSVLLLNTDLHVANIGQKMSRSQFIRNTLPTILRLVSDCEFEASISQARAGTWPKTNTPADDMPPPLPRSPTLPFESQVTRSSADEAVPVLGTARSGEKLVREGGSAGAGEVDPGGNEAGPLVMTPWEGTLRAWEFQVEHVLKRTYTSIAKERLPLFGAKAATGETSNLLSITGNMLRRSPSTLSKAASEHSRGRGPENRRTNGRWVSKTRSRPQLHPVSTVGSTRTSMDEGSSAWSPSMSSTWSRASGGKTLTSMSVDSLDSEGVHSQHQKSIGFANALSQAIIREDADASGGVVPGGHEEGGKAAPLLEDESLELSGAPWAKEGSLKHKHHLDGVDKRAKSRQWQDCFAVIEKGWMRLFSFSVNAKSLRTKAKERARAGSVVGGGNWQDSAEEVSRFLLRQTIASALPDPGYSNSRPYVWALSLPTGAVHLFQVGTPSITKEFVSTANYWSARLSKEPMMGSVQEREFGWSDAVINRALIHSESQPTMTVAMPKRGWDGGSRPSLPSSLRHSSDQASGGRTSTSTSDGRPKLAGDKIRIHEWSAPEQSMTASQLMEVDQLGQLQAYVQRVESELAKHNELRSAMQLAFPPRHPNTIKAMANWENKSRYLLREIVKFKTYVDSLTAAQAEKGKVLRQRREGSGGGGGGGEGEEESD